MSEELFPTYLFMLCYHKFSYSVTLKNICLCVENALLSIKINQSIKSLSFVVGKMNLEIPDGRCKGGWKRFHFTSALLLILSWCWLIVIRSISSRWPLALDLDTVLFGSTTLSPYHLLICHIAYFFPMIVFFDYFSLCLCNSSSMLCLSVLLSVCLSVSLYIGLSVFQPASLSNIRPIPRWPPKEDRNTHFF